MTGLPLAWGAVGDEHTRAWPVDARVPGPVLAMTRAVSVRAPVDLTWRWACQLFGRFATTYAVEPTDDPARCRLLCRLVVTRRGPVSALRSRLLAWGDRVMLRRQLLNLKGLAERDARRSGAD